VKTGKANLGLWIVLIVLALFIFYQYNQAQQYQQGKLIPETASSVNIDKISEIWSRIPFLGNLEFKPTMIAIVIILITYFILHSKGKK